MEIWKDIENYEGLYQVSNKGRVKSLDRIITNSNGVSSKLSGKLLTINSNDINGHPTAKLSNKIKNSFMVSRLVLAAFKGKCPKGYEVKHRDGDTKNNKLKNLFYKKKKINDDYVSKDIKIKTNALSWLTQEYVKSRLHYNKKTGIFKWKNCPDMPTWWNTRFAGKIAGNRLPSGYIHIYLKDMPILAHRLAWLYVKGSNCPNIIDHEDHDPSNNTWKNLRKAPGSKNGQNKLKGKSNTSGFKGVVKTKIKWIVNGEVKHKKRWKAHIYLNNKDKYIGIYKTKKEAHEAYCKTAKKYFGKFAHPG